MWKVAWAGGLRWEGPTCNNGRAKSWHSWFGIKTRLSILIPTLSLLSVSHVYSFLSHIYTHSLALSYILTLSHTHTFSSMSHIHTLSLSLFHTHTHTHTLSHTFSHNKPSFALFHTHTHTHTHTHCHTNTHITFSLLLLFHTQSLPPRHGRICHTPV